MKLYETGRVCVKTMGREAGSYCVVVEQSEGKYVIVTGPQHLSGVRRRRANIGHLEPLETIISIKEGADDQEVENAIREAGLEETFRSGVRLPE
ncbi:MAG: 50S ribosomal protein L14e [Candidatus Thorarchaeota archaeon]|nr:MAG: 50S ribosomal protein L14e [Candidatus Thorarchaeota archaeon]